MQTVKRARDKLNTGLQMRAEGPYKNPLHSRGFFAARNVNGGWEMPVICRGFCLIPEVVMVSAFLCVSGVLIAIVIEPPIFALFERLPCEHLSSPAGHPSILASLACSFGMHGASLLYNKDLYAPYPDRTELRQMPVAMPQEAEIRPALEDGRRQMPGQLSIAPQVHSDASLAPYIHESCFIVLISTSPFCCFL